MTSGVCRFCGQVGEGEAFRKWVRPTFTDHDKLLRGDIACFDCLFWFDEASAELAQRMGKDKPQRMRTYSHFVVDGVWTPLSKADKRRMRDFLLTPPFPELAVIADSGQKHLVFRATRNPAGVAAGWVQFEEAQLWVEPDELAGQMAVVDALYATFSKTEIASGQYLSWRIQEFGIELFLALEEQARAWRGSLLFALALFLAQKEERHVDNARGAANGGDVAAGSLAGNTAGLQKQIPGKHLAAVRGSGVERGDDGQPGEVHQHALFEL